jgi:hypothetical protein
LVNIADSNAELVEAFKAEALPTTVIVTAERKIARRLTGYQSADQLGLVLASTARAAGSNTVRSKQRESKTLRAAVDRKTEGGLSVSTVSETVAIAPAPAEASPPGTAASMPDPTPAVAERPAVDLLAGGPTTKPVP